MGNEAHKFEFTKATGQKWVFREERNCASVVADLAEKCIEFQIAGSAYEKEVEPYFFYLTLGITSSGWEDKHGRELSGSYHLTREVR